LRLSDGAISAPSKKHLFVTEMTPRNQNIEKGKPDAAQGQQKADAPIEQFWPSVQNRLQDQISPMDHGCGHGQTTGAAPSPYRIELQSHDLSLLAPLNLFHAQKPSSLGSAPPQTGIRDSRSPATADFHRRATRSWQPWGGHPIKPFGWVCQVGRIDYLHKPIGRS
jgi:hypothetical protein